ncbi:hypothetical protein [Terriglobus tenax]|uniref:hypothetical protein n=1 Tax=Terriglobus tenax TaxID=1111115 RepID=UPI0021E07E07|nr:hypothetical protein [Terriglobus tenax]
MGDLNLLNPDHWGQAITAIGAFGTAAFGIVDATKAFWGGISRAGLGYLRGFLGQVAVPTEDSVFPPDSALTNAGIFETIKAKWLNGTVLADQKSALKALIKLRLNPSTAASLARATAVDATLLAAVAAKLVRGAGLSTDPAQAAAETQLTPAEMDVYSRFDLILTTLIDRAYERADQFYRNCAKLLAGVVAVLLALLITASTGTHEPVEYGRAVLVGLLATPLAPIAKDLSTAVATAVKTFKAT